MLESHVAETENAILSRTGIFHIRYAYHPADASSDGFVEHAQLRIRLQIGEELIKRIEDGREYVIVHYSGDIKPKVPYRDCQPIYSPDDWMGTLWASVIIILRSHKDADVGEFVAYKEATDEDMQKLNESPAEFMGSRFSTVSEKLLNGKRIWLCQRVQ